MRPFAVALLAISAAPAFAQLTGSILPNAGYDLGYSAPTVGLGLEVGWNPPSAPVTVHMRASGDVVFVESLPFGDPFFGPTIVVVQPEPIQDESVIRLGLEAVGRWEHAPLPVTPYAKAGLVLEDERARWADMTLSYRQPGATVGLGLEVGRVYLEGTHGFGDASRRRLAIGVRL